jgi:hypothetical protein
MRPITWRAVLLTQSLALLYGITPWLEQWGQRTQPQLGLSLLEQMVPAFLIMLAAFAADDFVRRGGSVLRVFATALAVACALSALAQWGVELLLGVDQPLQRYQALLTTFLNVGAYWGTPLLVYLNRESATRLLATLRAGELRRAEAEHRTVAANLAATEARINPAAVLRKLADVRSRFATSDEEADARLDELIEELRATVARIAVP